MDDDRFAFNRGVIRPLECLREGWQLIKEDYWLFLGISFVGGLIAGLVPFYIMFGPMVCGIFICLFRQQQGRTPKFENLFDGFHYFAQSLIATMILFVPLAVIFITLYFLLIVGMIATMQQGQPDPGIVFGMVGVFYAVLFGTLFLVRLFAFFMYPLIVDRELTGVQALTLSARAVMGNLGGVLTVVLLEGLLNVAGVMCCFIGAVFVAPVSSAVTSVTYRRVFPEEDRLALLRADDEPLDDDDDVDSDTRIQTEGRPRRSSDSHVRE